MKKTSKILFIAVILTALFAAVMPLIAQESDSNIYPISDFRIPGFKDEYYVQPDLGNPYQGTWISKGNRTYMIKLIGKEAEIFTLVRILGVPTWRGATYYQVDDTWILSDNNSTLNPNANPLLRGLLYERYIRE